MSNGEREMVVTLEKILNWESAAEGGRFQLAFFSLKTSGLILERTLQGEAARGEMVFNYSLKVTYLPDENELILRLSHLPARALPLLLTELVLSLRALASRPVQFFPLGSNDRVLKVVAAHSQPQPRCPLHLRPAASASENEAFLREKHQFLQRFTNSSSASSLSRPQTKKSFSQRAHDLLGELQHVKAAGRRPERRQEEAKTIEQEFNDYCQDPISSYYAQHDRLLASKHGQRAGRTEERGTAGCRESESTRRSNRSQKHRLELKSLEMVAVENEYYEELEERKLKRRSDFYGQDHYRSRQALNRWDD